MDKRSQYKILMDKVLKGTHHLHARGITSEKLNFNIYQREFIVTSMTKDACEEVIRTLDFHERCQQAGIDDGRRYWCFKHNGKIIGLTGYHYRIWDHPDIVWAAWFVADPKVSALSKLGMIYNNMYICLTQTRFRDMYIELLGDGTNSNIYNIFKALGLEEIATFRHFHGQNKDMVVMRINLAELRTFSKEEYDLDTIC
ncbi:hypothetical protein EC835_11528 [Providencia alcalifaciens]|uniref:N-acetyltransferase n=1 Tax=Providencia alcalifaciens TaxID=126385 RepID=A0A4R3NEZ9_9GAMM|nr:hypothetical protein [Providencia alcalifaciens]MBC5792372.1 hypothetical protein [Providencia sp. JUb39]TCT28831.1 hypothetical protein EC835_11528 [Providencia alcalifaciens]